MKLLSKPFLFYLFGYFLLIFMSIYYAKFSHFAHHEFIGGLCLGSSFVPYEYARNILVPYLTEKYPNYRKLWRWLF